MPGMSHNLTQKLNQAFEPHGFLYKMWTRPLVCSRHWGQEHIELPSKCFRSNMDCALMPGT
eukprot:5082803-Karenia_brevis.AAC.1